MVKLVSVRASRKYGSDENKDVAEDVNAFGYVVATLLLLAGSWLLLPGNKAAAGLWLWLIGLILVISVNLHDLFAQLNGFDFRLPLLTLDPQLALIEVAAPLIQAIGGVVYWIGMLLFLRLLRGAFDGDDAVKVQEHACRLLVAGPVLWLIGSIHNAFQVYERVDLQVQVMQKAVSIPMVVATTILVVSGIVNVVVWPSADAVLQAKTFAAYLSIWAAALLLLASVFNALRVIHMQNLDNLGASLEPLRGGAQERLENARDQEEPLLPTHNKEVVDEIEHHSTSPSAYKASVVKFDDDEQER